MNFDWNLDTIRWYQDANDYTGYFKKVADSIIPKLEGYSTFCDIGCGLGLIDLELCNYIESITCIDISKNAIEALEKNIKKRNISNIYPNLLNCNDINETWDVIFVSFFGSRNLKNFLPRCKKLIAVVGNKNQDNLFPERYRKFQKSTTDKVVDFLKKENIAYTLTETSLEFGQPFASIEDAKNFVRSLTGNNISFEELELFLSRKLTETGEKEFPYFIPRTKPIGIFEIQGGLK